jgi:hypothetical protein
LHFEREDVWKGCRRGIMGEILCTHMWNVKTVQWMREGEIKVNDGGGEFNYDVLYCIVRTLVNFTV